MPTIEWICKYFEAMVNICVRACVPVCQCVALGWNNVIANLVHFSIYPHIPALTVIASTNCSFQDDVPIRSEAFALCTNLSTVF